ncbi:SPOR domain-containing protein [Chitinimonas sp.]|uniref:SPOR domain-containing protein n=1 Tax=Chitinimonas sp. TaxID=1934313 RepID=UPI0035B26126
MADAPISEELTALKKRARRRLIGAVALMLVALIVLWTVMDNHPPPSLANQSVAIVSSDPALTTTVKPDGKAPSLPITAAPAKPVDPLLAPSPVAPPPVKPSKPDTASQPAAAHETQAVAVPPTAKPAEAKAPEPKVTVSKPVEAHAAPEPAVEKPAKPEPAKKPEVARKNPAKILAGVEDEASYAAKPTPAHEASSHFYLQIGAFADAGKAQSLQEKAQAAGVSVQAEPVKTDKGSLTRLRAGPYASRDAAEKAHSKLQSGGVNSTIVGK